MMKKNVIILSIFLIITSVLTCVGSISNSKLRKQLYELQSENESLSYDIKSSTTDQNNTKEEFTKNQSTEKSIENVVVTLVDKNTKEKDFNNEQYYDLVTMKFDVQNNTDKDIQGVQGTITFKDLFGVKIITIGCDFVGKTIKAHSTVNYNDLIFETKDYKPDHVKLYTTDYKDLKYDYNVTSIVFTDGTKIDG